MISTEKSLRVIVQSRNGWAGTMKPKRWAVLVMGFPVLGLLLFLVLPFRTALFLYALVTRTCLCPGQGD